MKRGVLFCLINVIYLTYALAQAPMAMSYQAVIRDANGNVIANTPVGLRIGIIQGTSTTAPIYQEVFLPNPQTNAYGVLNLNIGSGTVQLGNFSSINWAASTYSIKIDVDPDGGTNYTITSLSQLLSVPYSFYSMETGASVPAHYVGEFYGGGIVFYVDHTGNHGLICSVVEISSASTWSDNPTTLIGPTAQSSWDGQNNSSAIILQSTANSAADLCDNYVNTNYGTGIFNDWYLPAIDELSLLFQSKYAINKVLDSDGNGVTIPLALDIYWSSTENSAISAWALSFTTGSIIGNDKLCTPVRVRAIRAF